MAVTLSCGDNGALGPPISVLTHPGLTKTQVMPRGAKSIAATRHPAPRLFGCHTFALREEVLALLAGTIARR